MLPAYMSRTHIVVNENTHKPKGPNPHPFIQKDHPLKRIIRLSFFYNKRYSKCNPERHAPGLKVPYYGKTCGSEESGQEEGSPEKR